MAELMPDLVERLLAAIDAKARRAEAALGSVWAVAGVEMIADGDTSFGGTVIHAGDGRDGGVFDEGTAAFIADNDPDAVLRKCQADRVLLDIVRHVNTRDGAAMANLARIVIRQLAEGYGVSETGYDITETEEAR